MTTSEMMRQIGKRGTISSNGLTVAVMVADVKSAYGRIRYQVVPVAGSGSTWVEFVRFEA